jgi:RNA-directed DNA polymerase
MKAIRKHTNTKWVILYIERWLKASMQMPDGSIKERNCGTPQGGVISPVLANLFLHYVFDTGMNRNHKDKPWARYADDAVIHCKTQEEAQKIILELKTRFEECKLELHPDKTKIACCRRDSRKNENNKFNFLGYEFRKRRCKSKDGHICTGFTPAASPDAIKAMCKKIKESRIKTRTEISIQEIARQFNPVLTGWINY